MKQFVNKNSPGLFQDLLTCVTGGKSLSENRRKLQEQRVVALLHSTVQVCTLSLVIWDLGYNFADSHL